MNKGKIKTTVIKKENGYRKKINIDNNNLEPRDVESNRYQHGKDCGTGDQMVSIDETETLRILSKNPRGFCFEDGKDDKLMAGI